MLTAEPPALATARTLLARGLSVIPVPFPRPGAAPNTVGDGKVPELPWTAFQSRYATVDELVTWFGHGPMNVAIVTGAISGVVVVDADARESLRWCTSRLPYTPWQTRTTRGYHLFYRHPGTPIANRAKLRTRDGRLELDLRGDGGFVIAPGSTHASGTVYACAGDWTVGVEALPVFWPGWIAGPVQPRADHAPGPRPTGDVIERARKYLAAIPVPVIGAGSDSETLYAAARLVRGFALDASDAEQLLWEWAGGRPGWTRGWLAAKVRHAERYGREPVGALR